MPLLELYENKVLSDAELPIQINYNAREKKEQIFLSHWHEHLELHYIVEGEAVFQLNQTQYEVVPGDCVVINSNELHTAHTTALPYLAHVVIFNMADLSAELAEKNYIFHQFIRGDDTIRSIMARILLERQQENTGYKQLCRGLALELLVHLCRNHVAQSLPKRDSRRRQKDLDRLNTVLSYIESHVSEPITNAQLAQIACLSEDRFSHVFRDGVGKPPLQYINDMRLQKALSLLRSSGHTVTEIAEMVGFRDYNHFGRLFRKRYGYTPYEIKQGKNQPEETE